MSAVTAEIESQPAIWRRIAELAPSLTSSLPAAGSRAAVIGCGTSFYMAQAVAVLRERRGHGETDAFAASEMPVGRAYDQVVAISRSGTTTEVVRALESLAPGALSVAVSATPSSPVIRAADQAVLLAFADERSIVQTRFATAVLALMRAHLGEDLEPVIAQGLLALERALPVELSEFEQFVFLGAGWSVGLALEAALKFREAAGAWSEAYPAMEYRHGPISVAGPGTLVWMLGAGEPDLVADVHATGATVIESDQDPMVELIVLQRAAVALAQARGLDPDRPNHLSRSVVLP